jgi:integrase
MLSIRKRKGSPHWYIRGTVRVGKTTVRIEEFSAGSSERHIAEAERARLQRETELAILHGRPAVQCRTGLAEAVVNYSAAADRADLDRTRIIYEHFGDVPMQDITPDAFERFCAVALPGRSPNTHHRYRTVLRGLFRAAGVPVPAFAPKARPREIVEFLSAEDADRLIAAYDKRVRPVAIVARYSGLRAQELARLQRRDVDLIGGTILVRAPKNNRDRLIPLHPAARAAIADLCDKRAGPERLFKTQCGQDYRARGNPFTHAHTTALRRAGVANFRWHGWRHHWATWAVRPAEMGGAGMDLVTLMRVGGWSSLGQVQRYAAASIMARAGDMLARVR